MRGGVTSGPNAGGGDRFSWPMGDDRFVENYALPKPAKLLLCAAVSLLLLVTIARVYYAWRFDVELKLPPGVWIALASDVKDGIFYSPLYSEQYGYGGTRYFPLFFTVHGLIMKLGGEPRTTGYAISAASVLMLLGGVFVLLRKLGLNAQQAAAFAALVLAAESAQWALLSIRADALPAAFIIWALAFCVDSATGWGKLVAAAVLLSLAFATKVSSAYGLGATFISLWLCGHLRSAWKLLALTTTGFAVVLGVMHIASHGRALGILQATLMGGGSFDRFTKGPLLLVHIAQTGDPGSTGFLLLGFAALLALHGRAFLLMPPVFFICAVGLTSVVMGSPGSNINHLLDLHVASIILIAASFSHEDARHRGFLASALVAAAFLALTPLSFNLLRAARSSESSRLEAVVRAVPASSKPLLAENPYVALLAGERPYVLDPFVVRTVAQRNPAFLDPLLKKLRAQEFRAVVLVVDPRSDDGREWYISTHFGDGFREVLESNYHWSDRVGGQYIYLPNHH